MSLGGPEILVILIVALMLLGPDKLPSALKTAGKAFGEFKKYQNMAKTEIDKAVSLASEPTIEKKKEELKSPILFEDQSNSIQSESSSVVMPIIDEDD